MQLLRKLLIPIVPIYFVVTWLRNKCFDLGIFKSTAFKVPTIAVGNLSVGGTGKTPMVEYLVRLLIDKVALASLSRGYKRLSTGFVLAGKNHDELDLGDEAFQLHLKFKKLIVAVDANRVRGVSKLLSLNNAPKVILLDDAFQHRKLKSSLYILLTSYDDLYSHDILLPTGNLREPRSGAKRAHLIVVTKCPVDLSAQEQERIISSLKPHAAQKIFFSCIAYSNTIYSSIEERQLEELKGNPFTLLTGIANPKPLVSYLENNGYHFNHLQYEDHHHFTEKELEALNKTANQTKILTTEKDYVRLNIALRKKVYYLPIAHNFIEGKSEFDELVINLALRN
jgi:tetraacyldisaccharide 4'-kinase